jgi:2-polyprenyl-3-methyl-5-hydroxy-6-metoxy-1,4-benzoquinol methylase
MNVRVARPGIKRGPYVRRRRWRVENCGPSVRMDARASTIETKIWGGLALVGYAANMRKTLRRATEWFQDEAFWREFYPFMFSERRIAEADEQMAKVLALTKPSGKVVLDLCCGPGRCSIALARKGFRVTGVDRTNYLLKKARERARAARVNVEWVQNDMRDFVRLNSFALVISMFTSFGYFDDKQEDMTVLGNMFGSLQAGGICLIETLGKERLAKVLQATTSSELPDGSVVVERHRIFDDWTRIENEWSILRDGRVKTFKFHHTIYSGQELRDRMEWAGFVDVRLYGNLDGDEYGPEAERLIAVGRKAESRQLGKKSLR